MILENRYHFGVATWSEQALSELHAAGYRRGLARARVIDFLDAQDCCVGAQEIHRELVTRGAQEAQRYVLDVANAGRRNHIEKKPAS